MPYKDGSLEGFTYKPKNTKDCQQNKDTRNKKRRIPLLVSKGAWLYQHLDF
jgi:hypothetical protein